MLASFVLLFYIATYTVEYDFVFNDFLLKCKYNEQYSNNLVIEHNLGWNNALNKEEWDEFAIQNGLNEMGCTAYFELGLYKTCYMISPYAAQSLFVKGNNFTVGYEGNGSIEKPYEAYVSKDSGYSIGQTYSFTPKTDESINVKVIGILEENYCVQLSFLDYYGGFFSGNNVDLFICAVPTKNISRVIITDKEKVEDIEKIFGSNEIKYSTIKELYDAQAEEINSVNNANIIKIIMVFLIIISTIVCNTFYHYDNFKKYNKIKRSVGENKVQNIATDFIIGTVIFVLAFLIIFTIGLGKPAIFYNMFPNMGFWIAVVTVGLVHFGVLIAKCVFQSKAMGMKE